MSIEASPRANRSHSTRNGYEIRLCRDSLSQDSEWFDVRLGSRWQRLRLHDYDKIYAVPGLYEAVYNRLLRCTSPERVVSLLREAMADGHEPTGNLRVLDLGAGNGLVSEELRCLPVAKVLGVDILPEARQAALRDRGWCFDDYIVANLLDLPEETEALLRNARFNGLTCVAALDFGDIPKTAFLKALDLIEAPGWLAFNVKETFLQEELDDGFARLLGQLTRTGVIKLQAYRRYQHRVSCAGQPLHYIAVVATKERVIPHGMLAPRLDPLHRNGRLCLDPALGGPPERASQESRPPKSVTSK